MLDTQCMAREDQQQHNSRFLSKETISVQRPEESSVHATVQGNCNRCCAKGPAAQLHLSPLIISIPCCLASSHLFCCQDQVVVGLSNGSSLDQTKPPDNLRKRSLTQPSYYDLFLINSLQEPRDWIDGWGKATR